MTQADADPRSATRALPTGPLRSARATSRSLAPPAQPPRQRPGARASRAATAPLTGQRPAEAPQHLTCGSWSPLVRSTPRLADAQPWLSEAGVENRFSRRIQLYQLQMCRDANASLMGWVARSPAVRRRQVSP